MLQDSFELEKETRMSHFIKCLRNVKKFCITIFVPSRLKLSIVNESRTRVEAFKHYKGIQLLDQLHNI